jgi:hypothetical protein
MWRLCGSADRLWIGRKAAGAVLEGGAFGVIGLGPALAFDHGTKGSGPHGAAALDVALNALGAQVAGAGKHGAIDPTVGIRAVLGHCLYLSC